MERTEKRDALQEFEESLIERIDRRIKELIDALPHEDYEESRQTILEEVDCSEIEYEYELECLVEDYEISRAIQMKLQALQEFKSELTPHLTNVLSVLEILEPATVYWLGETFSVERIEEEEVWRDRKRIEQRIGTEAFNKAFCSAISGFPPFFVYYFGFTPGELEEIYERGESWELNAAIEALEGRGSTAYPRELILLGNKVFSEIVTDFSDWFSARYPQVLLENARDANQVIAKMRLAGVRGLADAPEFIGYLSDIEGETQDDYVEAYKLLCLVQVLEERRLDLLAQDLGLIEVVKALIPGMPLGSGYSYELEKINYRALYEASCKMYHRGGNRLIGRVLQDELKRYLPDYVMKRIEPTIKNLINEEVLQRLINNPPALVVKKPTEF